MIQRCLQLSLRLSTRLRALPSSHALHGFCKAATRNFKCRRRASSETHETGGNVEAFSTDRGRSFVSPGNMSRGRPGAVESPGNNSRGRHGAVGDALTPIRLGVEAEESGGIDGGSGLALTRYSDVVEEVVSLWCRDAAAFDLEPLWLLPKLRSHKNWEVALQMCAAVACSWEEQYQEREREHATGSAAGGASGLHPRSANLASVLVVFDTLADACFVNFRDGDAKTLAAALGTMWAADWSLQRAIRLPLGASQRFSTRIGGREQRGGLGGASSPEQGPTTTGGRDQGELGGGSGSERESTLTGGRQQGRTEAGSDSEQGTATAASTSAATMWGEAHPQGEVARPVKKPGVTGGVFFGADSEGREDEGGGFVGEDAGGGGDGEGGEWAGRASGDDGGGRSWIEESKTVDVVRGLTQRCQGSLRGADNGNSGGGGVGSDGVDVSIVSDSGGGEWASVMSPQDLAEAVVDGVGPAAAGDVLAACPQLLDSMSPEFFTGLADRHAALRRQKALEGTLLREATAAVWAAQQGRLGEGPTEGSGVHSVGTGAGDRTSHLGPRLAWLACEELTSFFQHHDHLQARESGRRPTARTAQAWANEAIPHHPAQRRLFEEGTRYPNENEGDGEGGSRWRGRQLLDKEQLLKLAVAKTGVNLVLPANAHHGVTLKPRSPCVFCGLPLSDSSIPTTAGGGGGVGGGGGSGGGDDGLARIGDGATFPSPEAVELGLAVRPCGHGYHARCMEQSVGGWSEGGDEWGVSLRCPECR